MKSLYYYLLSTKLNHFSSGIQQLCKIMTHDSWVISVIKRNSLLKITKMKIKLKLKKEWIWNLDYLILCPNIKFLESLWIHYESGWNILFLFNTMHYNYNSRSEIERWVWFIFQILVIIDHLVWTVKVNVSICQASASSWNYIKNECLGKMTW